MKHGTILVVDDNRNILATVRMILENTFEKIVTIASPGNIPARLREDKPDVVLLDMNFQSGINTGNEGIFWLHEIKRMRPQTQVVLFTAYADIDLAVRGIKEGAADFMAEEVLAPIKRDVNLTAEKIESLLQSSQVIEQAIQETLVNAQNQMQDLQLMVEKVAPTDANILITGENGTGKEVLAREIHRLSQRADGPMVAVDLGAVTETLFESELFGHMKGAFTDAKADKPGKFELANGGTLFLDEIGNLSYGLQAKLLTALQRRCIVRVGGSKEIPIDVRLICATNKDLQKMVAEGTFREDLLYRINTIHLHLPPMRERKGDIADLARRFLNRYATMYNRTDMTLSDEAAERIEQLPWPGNIRELQHAMEKAVILTDGNVIGPEVFASKPTTESIAIDTKEPQTLDEMEKAMIAKTIRLCGGNLSQVAQQLDISRQTLYNKIKKYGL